MRRVIADFEQGITRIGCIRKSRHEMSRKHSKRGKDKSERSHHETLSSLLMGDGTLYPSVFHLHESHPQLSISNGAASLMRLRFSRRSDAFTPAVKESRFSHQLQPRLGSRSLRQCRSRSINGTVSIITHVFDAKNNAFLSPF